MADILQNPWFLENLPPDILDILAHPNVEGGFEQQGREEAKYLVKQARALPEAPPQSTEPASLQSIGTLPLITITFIPLHKR